MKKNAFITLLFLFVFCLPNTFGQSMDESKVINSTAKQRNSLTFDIFGTVFPSAVGLDYFKGICLDFKYERKINHYFSTLGEISYLTNFNDIHSYSITPQLRLYPFKSSIQRLFADIGISLKGRKSNEDNYQQIGAAFAVGWKFSLGKGLVLEPGVTYHQKITEISGKNSYNNGMGLIMGIGWSF